MTKHDASEDIRHISKKVMRYQLVFGSLFIAYQFLSHDYMNVFSAIFGVVIATVPNLLGIYSATRLYKMHSEMNEKDVMYVASVLKLFYTVMLFIVAFRYLHLDNLVTLSSYCIAFVGYFSFPIISKKTRVRTT